MSRLRILLDKKKLTEAEKAEVSKLFLAMAQHENQLEDEACRGIHRATQAELAWRQKLPTQRSSTRQFIVELITAGLFIGLLTYLLDLVR
jgi:hypothetical protein